eukprot:gene666-1334_t
MADQLTREEIIKTLFEIGAVKFGEFTLKTGLKSPVYFDLRVLISFPKLMCQVSEMLWKTVDSMKTEYSYICGVPYTALPLATCISAAHNIPMLIRRKEAKDYGTKKIIEGIFEEGKKCLIVEDVVTSGGSVFETAQSLEQVNLKITDAVVLLNREQGGLEKLHSNGITLHCVFTVSEVLNTLQSLQVINADTVSTVQRFLQTNVFSPLKDATVSPGNLVKPCESTANPTRRLTYAEREQMSHNPVSQRLWKIMSSKKTNLAFSADVTCCKTLLELADKIGPSICILKTHADILVDFNEGFVKELRSLATKHNFLIFEDRKFADIGNTVKHQFSGGLYNTASWADMITVHLLPGEGIISGLKEAAKGQDKGCLLIAQMSSEGNLIDEKYTRATLDAAKKHEDFVMGFICTSSMGENPEFLKLTPGVHLNKSGDTLGQNYNTPEDVICNKGSDIIIVGRGIYQAENPVLAAEEYQKIGFSAYLKSINQ